MSAKAALQDRLGIGASTASDGVVPASGKRYVKHVHRPRHRFETRVREVWIYRFNIWYFATDFLQNIFGGMWLGWLWLPLRPALGILTKGFVFGGMLHIGSGDRPYIIFLMVGQASWDFFDRLVYYGFKGLRSHRRMIERLPVPWAAAIISLLSFAAFDAATFLVIGVAASTYYKVTQGSFYISLTPFSSLRLLFGVLLLAAWGVSLSMIFSPVIMKIRDMRYLIRYGIRFWYFITPVLYATTTLPGKYRVFAIYNPVTAPIEIIKDSLLGTGAPYRASLVVSLVGIAVVMPLAFVICAAIERGSHDRI